MSEIIKSITEAYSCQPKHFELVREEDLHYWIRGEAVKEIKLESLVVGDNPSTAFADMFYVGYNHDGKKIFQYLANSVNVQYKTT